MIYIYVITPSTHYVNPLSFEGHVSRGRPQPGQFARVSHSETSILILTFTPPVNLKSTINLTPTVGVQNTNSTHKFPAMYICILFLLDAYIFHHRFPLGGLLTLLALPSHPCSWWLQTICLGDIAENKCSFSCFSCPMRHNNSSITF